MLGIILLLHFGFFSNTRPAWQRAGVPVKPLMRAPWARPPWVICGALVGIRVSTPWRIDFSFGRSNATSAAIAATLAYFSPRALFMNS
jgi:hypothetical protein